MAKFKPMKNTFQLAGVVEGTGGKFFFKEGKTKSGKTERSTSFRIRYNKEGSAEYVELKGWSGDVYVYDNQDKKTIQMNSLEYKAFMAKEEERVKAVLAKDKNAQNVRRYSLMSSVTIKLNKDEEAVTLSRFDAVTHITDYLKANPDMTVRVMGDIDYSMFRNKEGEVNVVKKLTITRIYASDIDLETIKKEDEVHAFKANFVMTDVTVDGENSEVSGYTIARKGQDDLIIPVNFEVTPKLAGAMQKVIKPYSALEMQGYIIAELKTEEVEEEQDESILGEEVSTYKKKVATSYEKRLLGASVDTKTINEEDYEEEVIKNIFANQVLFGDEAKKEDTLGEIKEATKVADDYDFDF